MEIEKQIKKLMRQAELINNVTISQENIVKINKIQDFVNAKGELFYHQETETFYKKVTEDSWLAFSNHNPIELILAPDELPKCEDSNTSIKLPNLDKEDHMIHEFSQHRQIQIMEDLAENIQKQAKEISTIKLRLDQIEKGHQEYINWSHKLINYIKKEMANLSINQDNHTSAIKSNVELRLKAIAEKLLKGK